MKTSPLLDCPTADKSSALVLQLSGIHAGVILIAIKIHWMFRWLFIHELIFSVALADWADRN